MCDIYTNVLCTLLSGICIMCDIYTHYTSLLCKDVMFESHLDHLDPLHAGGTLIDCYLCIIGVSGCHKFWRHCAVHNSKQSTIMQDCTT